MSTKQWKKMIEKISFMKDKVLFENNEFFLLRDFPEEPKIRTVKLYVDYEKSVEACIAAKTRIDNPEQYLLIIRSDGKTYVDIGEKGSAILLKDGSILDLPDKCRV